MVIARMFHSQPGRVSPDASVYLSACVRIQTHTLNSSQLRDRFFIISFTSVGRSVFGTPDFDRTRKWQYFVGGSAKIKHGLCISQTRVRVVERIFLRPPCFWSCWIG